jgi:hypothetical protein
MSRSNYHRKQAELLASLALSTTDAAKADKLKLAAMEHLNRAQELEGISSPLIPAADQNEDCA